VSAAENGLDKFFVQFLDFDNDIFLALSALAGMIWWGIGRRLYATRAGFSARPRMLQSCTTSRMKSRFLQVLDHRNGCTERIYRPARCSKKR
jgi:hypothetical protein